MVNESLLLVFLLAVTPVLEWRGAIPVGVAYGIPVGLLLAVVGLAILVEAGISQSLLLLAGHGVRRLPLWSRLERVRDRFLEQHRRGRFIGLWLFVFVPLPFTGVYAGSALGWLLGMRTRSNMLAVVTGAVASSVMVWVFFAVLKQLLLFGGE